MPDLSNLLGAVYGDTPSSKPPDPEDEAHVEREPAADERGPAVPDWADDEHLDAAFAEWKPGPAEDAAPAEHAFVKETDDDDPPPPLPDDLAAALSEALVASSGAADDTDDYAFKPTKVVDFSDPHAEDEVDEDQDEDAPEPTNLSEPETDRDERGETEQVREDHLRHLPAITPQRAAAAELTAANRAEPTAVIPPTAAEPESAPPATVPTPTVPLTTAPTPLPAPAAPMVTVPAGARRWERSEDDILPEKQTKKFFSFSLRRG